MKKKIAVLLMFMVSSVSILTGCNLFNTDNYASLSSIVATCGDIEITREELINAYNNSGYYYTYYSGMSQEDAVKKTIEDLVNQQYLLQYIDSSNDEKLKLDSYDYSKVVSDTWNFINKSLEPYIQEVRKDFGLDLEEIKSETEEKEPEFAPQKQYVTKFIEKNGHVVYIQPEKEVLKVNQNFASEQEALAYAKNNFDYMYQIKGSNDDYKKIVWNKFITDLKKVQSKQHHSDMSNSICFNREIERVFDLNIKNQKITKYENLLKSSNGFAYDESNKEYYVNDSTLENIVKYYKKAYNKQFDLYGAQQDKNDFYKSLTSKTNRDDIFYYGTPEEETLITCSHILIKLSSEQIEELKTVREKYRDEGAKAQAVQNILNKTMAFERDLTTGEVIDKDGITVYDLYNNLKASINTKTTLEERTKVFNNFLYRYNVDTGIVNAHYDYVVGTKNSTMVESFTNEVRRLNREAQIGDISGLVLEENSNYSGFHIILYTGTLQNKFNSNSELDSLNENNVYQILGYDKTSISYNQTYFEYIFDKVVTENYNDLRNKTIESVRNGEDIHHNNANFKDLY